MSSLKVKNRTIILYNSIYVYEKQIKYSKKEKTLINR